MEGWATGLGGFASGLRKIYASSKLWAYNLSCYACQMNQLDSARLWLKRALSIGNREHVNDKLLDNTDLEPLWTEIKNY